MRMQWDWDAQWIRIEFAQSEGYVAIALSPNVTDVHGTAIRGVLVTGDAVRVFDMEGFRVALGDSVGNFSVVGGIVSVELDWALHRKGKEIEWFSLEGVD